MPSKEILPFNFHLLGTNFTTVKFSDHYKSGFNNVTNNKLLSLLEGNNHCGADRVSFVADLSKGASWVVGLLHVWA